MESQSCFRINRKDFSKALRKLLSIEDAGKKKESTLEVTVIRNYIILVIPGVELRLEAYTKGSAKFTIRLWYMAEIVRSEPEGLMHVDLNDNRMYIRNSSFGVCTTFFENDRILRSIELPVNYTETDLLKLLLSGRYTEEELNFNLLDAAARAAMEKTIREFGKFARLMKKYGFERKEVETLVFNRLMEKGKRSV